MSAEERAAFVVRGVVTQAMHDAGTQTLVLTEPASDASRLIERWCSIRFASGDATGLTVSAASKTELLLVPDARFANLCPLGDLYATDLAGWGVMVNAPDLQELADMAGGMNRLDDALRKLLDERRAADAAFAGLPHIRDAVMTRLQKTRFRRAQSGIIPKLGARTIGIDLYI